MATIDMTQRKLNFPPRFLPYLEKHRIFELFHECIELLIQVKPRDHIQFLKTILPCADSKKDKPRIVFFAPPDFERQKFAQMVADCLGIQVISRALLEMLTRERRLAELILIPEGDEKEEEESCICPGEDERIYPSMYYPTEEYSYGGTIGEVEEEEKQEEVEEEEEVKEVKEEPPEEPCICVCPCVKKEEEEKEKEEETKKTEEEESDDKKEEISEDKEESSKQEEEAWERGEEPYLPCIPTEKKKKKKKKRKKTEEILADSISSFQIDFKLLSDCQIASRGWILSDFPTTGEEAAELCALGVIPTHALRLYHQENDEMDDRNQKWNIVNWTKAYKFVPVTEIKINDRDLEILSADMCKLLSRMPHRHAPMLPRIVLIGSRGSGTTTQAMKLAKKYRLVHVEFETVIAQLLQQDDEIARLYKQQMATRVEPELEAIVLEKVLLTSACRNRGWVLTGYPRNIDQMRMLDIIATPPNRIIFIEVPARECFVRLYYRKFDPCLGDEYKLPKILPAGFDSYETQDIDPEIASRLLTHPKNEKKQILYDIETYFMDKKEMMAYCEKSAFYVNGNKAVDTVFELIEDIIIGSGPATPPRDPLAVNHGIDESYERLKKFRLVSGMYFNNLVLNPPESLYLKM